MRTIKIQMSALLCVLMMMTSCSSDDIELTMCFPEHLPDLMDMRDFYADGAEWVENISSQTVEVSDNGHPNGNDTYYLIKQELDDRGKKRLRIYRDSHKTSMLLYVDEKEITGEIESTHERKKLYDFSSGLVHGEKFSFSLFELKDGEAIGFKDFDVTLQDVEITSGSAPYPYYPWLLGHRTCRSKGYSTLEGSEIYSFIGQIRGEGGLFCYDSEVNWTEKTSQISAISSFGPEGWSSVGYHFFYGVKSY